MTPHMNLNETTEGAISNCLEDHSMHVLLKGKGVEKKVCASSIFADIIRVCKTLCGSFLD